METPTTLEMRLAQPMRTGSDAVHDTLESDLVTMAADPEIQTELHRIQLEFSVTEMDGLDRV